MKHALFRREPALLTAYRKTLTRDWHWYRKVAGPIERAGLREAIRHEIRMIRGLCR